MQVSFFSIGEEAGQVKYVKAGQKPFGQFCCLTSSSLNNCSKFMHGHCKYTGHTAVLWTHGEQSRKSVLNTTVLCTVLIFLQVNHKRQKVSQLYETLFRRQDTFLGKRPKHLQNCSSRTRIVTSELLLC